MEPKNNTAYSGQPSSQPSSQPSGNPYGASPTGAKPNSPNSNKYRNWCIWGGLIIALLIVLGACCYHIVARGSAPVVVTDSLSTRLLQDSSSNNKNRIVQLTPEFINAVQKYDELSPYSEGYAAVRKNGRWGYIDTWGREVIPCQYSAALSFHEGLAAVGLPSSDGRSSTDDTDWPQSYLELFGSHRWAFIDTQGQVVIPPFDDHDMYLPGAFSEGRVVFMSGDLRHFTVVDRKGNVVLKDTNEENPFSFCGSVYMLPYECPTVDEKYIDGKLYIPTANYYRVYDTEGNRLKDVSSEEKEKIEEAINAGSETTFTRSIFFDVPQEGGYYYNTPAMLYLWGVKDVDGRVVIPAEYDHLGIYSYPDNPIALSNGVALVALVEYKESEGLNLIGRRRSFFSEEGRTYYGYADLKGNDTFPKGLKERCKKARQRAIQEYLESEEGVYGVNNLVNGKNLPEPATQDEAQVAAAY